MDLTSDPYAKIGIVIEAYKACIPHHLDVLARIEHLQYEALRDDHIQLLANLVNEDSNLIDLSSVDIAPRERVIHL